MYVALAAGVLVGRVVWNAPVETTPVEFALLAGLGVALLYGGYRLTHVDVQPAFYPTIAAWCLGGFGGMLAILLLYDAQPSTSVSFSGAPILTGLGALAGYGVGINVARTRELRRTRRRLDETIERLQTSNERLEQFAYAASHDLQEPLRMVSSYLSLIERRHGDNLDREGLEFLELAVDGADRMLGMIDGLLVYSQVAASDDRSEPVDLDAVLEVVRSDLRRKIEAEDAEITAETLPTVDGKEEQLYHVFQNLLSNAIKYCGEEPPRVHVTAERDSTEWTLTIHDEGIGIDQEDADSIFEMFQRIHSREDSTGSGIGLAICEQIVERHGGEIWVDSEPGVGSSFSFTLPAASGGDRDA
ncbi:sensor histidine kinase [Natronorarus salvus]|uniref:sensor histidine kinase n=1 Tax=Natronorarus salvus TaxID=3117733 RepID=UPI002F26BC0E